ncbi:MAG: serine/threonine-protein phosphatase [Candidatus Solibacter usitatus]|nr:serine/threonine-protein phosphatase [Candidatus Solibacter usitatus]
MVSHWLALLLACASSAFAQYADLSGDWRISKDDNPRYADVNFDDSGWSSARLPWEVDRKLGVYWLRRTLRTPAIVDGQDAALVIGSVNESYEVYVNGLRIATTPGFGTNNPPYVEPRVFALAPEILRPANTVVALRIWRPARLVWTGAQRAKDFGPYLIAPAIAAVELEMAARMRMTIRMTWYLPQSLFLLFAACYLIWTYRRAREWRELFWLAVFCFGASGILMLIPLPDYLLNTSHAAIATLYNAAAAIQIIGFSEYAMAVLVIRIGFWRWFIWVPALLSALLVWLPLPISPAILPVALLAFWGARALQGDRKKRLIAFLILLYAVLRLNLISVNDLGIGLLPVAINFRHVLLPLGTVSVVVIVSMLFDTLGRLLRDKGEKQRMAGELQAAREIQQLMLSAAAPAQGEFTTDSVCYPAHEVGGDFYRILEDGDARLVVVGDVSGKGLKAAMHVSEIVGSLRMVRDRTPASVLSALNNALAGHLDGGFVTCCCARLEPGGTVRMANAGHLNPYRNGTEVDLDGGLPLGILPGAIYEETEIQLAPGDQLTFLSDGVVEAAGPTGELFGFDRTRAISGAAAARIAGTAREFGQNDDITVVTVRRS